MRRKYNYNVYGIVKRGNGFVRNNLCPDPTKPLNIFGVIGKILGFIIKKILCFPIHVLSFLITGLFYDKSKDSPYKGSFLYTATYICLMLAVGGVIGAIVNFCK